jgi:uncharacterized protein (DUF58 family)
MFGTEPDAMADTTTVRAENYLAPETLLQLAPFELRAKMIVEGVMTGQHRSPYQGMAVEFAQHRQYTAGDDLKHLDWKVYGRSDKLYLKQYQQETNLDVILLVDSSASMAYGTLGVKGGWGGTEASRGKGVWTKFDHAAATAVGVAYLSLQQGDRVGVAVFADEIRSMIKRSSSRGQWRSIVNTLSVHPVNQHTNFAKVTVTGPTLRRKRVNCKSRLDPSHSPVWRDAPERGKRLLPALSGRRAGMSHP